MEATEQELRFDLKRGSLALSLAYSLDLSQMSQRLMHNAMAKGQLYEPELCSFLMQVLQPGDVFVDVGAHVGYMSTLAGHLVGNEGLVLAIEPNASNFARLRSHLWTNRLLNATAVQRVIASRKEERRFHTNLDNDGGHCLWDPGLHSFNQLSAANPQSECVETDTLDSLLEEFKIRSPKVIKIDTEGAEHEVLRGAEGTLAQGEVPFIVAELHDLGLGLLGSSQAALRAFMGHRGYQSFLLSNDGALPTWVPPKTTITQESIGNILFAQIDALDSHWPTVPCDLRSGNSQ